MTCDEIHERLNDYVDGLIPDEEISRLEAHLDRCSRCQEDLRRLRSLLTSAGALPKSLSPGRDLWPSISARIGQQEDSVNEWVDSLLHKISGAGRSDLGRSTGIDVRGLPGRSVWGLRLVTGLAALVVIVASFWITVHSSRGSWGVARLEGRPTIGSDKVIETGRFQVGDWLQTDDSSRARINVGTIGEVEVEPNTRIGLVEALATEHRLALAHGTIHATISAPPRIFFVETASAVAVDLGCVYVLAVDGEGNGRLHVTAGWVEFQRNGRQSLVPAGALCETRAEVGPGTPYSARAAEELRNALVEFDFANGGVESLETVLALARKPDAITLWHLLSRVNDAERGEVYDHLTVLVPPPEGVTRDGVLELNREMLELWWWDIEYATLAG